MSRGGGEWVKRLSRGKDWVGEEEKGLKDWVRGGGGEGVLTLSIEGEEGVMRMRWVEMLK